MSIPSNKGFKSSGLVLISVAAILLLSVLMVWLFKADPLEVFKIACPSIIGGPVAYQIRSGIVDSQTAKHNPSDDGKG